MTDTKRRDESGPLPDRDNGPGSPRGASASSTLRAILAEYVLDRYPSVPRAALVSALQQCGLSPQATRQALSRAMRSGALEPTATRRGEVAVSGPAREALRMVTETTHSLGTPPSWDGTWSLVIIRGSGTAASPHGVRNTLLTEGLGRLGNGVWITPHSARSERTVALLEEDPALDLLTCTATFEHLRHPEIVAQAWDLERIRRGYDEFIELMTALSAGTDRERFVAWTTAVRAWHQLMHSDPGLPPETIGADWPWMQVRRLMTSARDSWRAAAVRHADALVTEKGRLL